MADDPLAILNVASERRLEFNSLVEAACRSFAIIEPWNNARWGQQSLTLLMWSTLTGEERRSENAILTPIIQDVKAQGLLYYHALDLSVKTAGDGYAFSADAEHLCTSLLDPQNTAEELQQFISEMRATVRRAHADATNMSELFRSVRQGLNQVKK